MTSQLPRPRAVVLPDEQRPVTPAVRSIVLFCASGYVAGEHWNERICGNWSAAEIAAACEAVDRLCRPGGDAQPVLDGLRALAEMLQVELPGPYGLDLLVEDLVLLPADLLDASIRGVARTHLFRRFPTLAEMRQCVIEELKERQRLARSVTALARDHRQRFGNGAPAVEASTIGPQIRGGGLRSVARCLPQLADTTEAR